MNEEQIEGQLAEFNGHFVCVEVPVRGTVFQTFLGPLEITPNWLENIIVYSIKFYPDQEISFQAQDVEKIVLDPNEIMKAIIFLKSDSPMQQLKFEKA
jgi:hypothetical protein